MATAFQKLSRGRVPKTSTTKAKTARTKSWFSKLSKTRQAAYLKAHPNSKYGKSKKSAATKTKKVATKPAAKKVVGKESAAKAKRKDEILLKLETATRRLKNTQRAATVGGGFGINQYSAEQIRTYQGQIVALKKELATLSRKAPAKRPARKVKPKTRAKK